MKTGRIFSSAFIACLLALLSGSASAQIGTWTPVTNLAPDPNMGQCLLMTDGTVACHTSSGGNLGDGTIWDILTPDSLGNYVDGTWSSIAPMTQERFSFSSQILKSGYIYAAGGEYGTDGTQAGWHIETYDPATNTWTEGTGTTSAQTISDGDCILLDNTDILQGLVDVPFPVHTRLFNPGTNALTTGPNTLGGSNEAMWLKLPDGSVLMVNEGSLASERYIPARNTWIADAAVPDSMYDPWGEECGPGWMLPNGEAFFIGGQDYTAIYTPSGDSVPGHWRTGPTIPNGYSMPDAPGAMMVNGHLLFACEPEPTPQNEFNTPTAFYEYNYLDSSYTSVPVPTSAASQNIAQMYTMLTLPNGQVLLAMSQNGNSSKQYYLYTPGTPALTSPRPVINSVTKLTCTTFMAVGTGFNGMSAGSAFGDENQSDNNYPLFRFKSNTGRIYYARSYNWNSTAVQRGNKPDTAYFEIPTAMGSGSYKMYCVAVGIASDSFPFTDSIATLSSPLTNSVCSGAPFTYTPASTASGATFTWTRAAVTGISNAAITTAQTTNPNETLINTTSAPITVTYAYVVNAYGCSNDVNVSVVVNPIPTAGFTGSPTTACVLPDSVTFTNTTIAGTSYVWTFGDGSTSTATSPVHDYTTGGNFTVKLVATSACGVDSITKSSYITLNPPVAPTATSPVTLSCSGNTATLTASGNDSLKWFTASTGGTQVGVGPTYTTPALYANTTYYVESYAVGSSDYSTPATDGFGTGGNYANSNFRSEVFNVNLPCTLVSVLVYASGAGNRTIDLEDSAGNVLNSATVNIPNGTSTVTLNFPLTVGTNYQLGCGNGTAATNLYRNSTGSAYPYSDPSGYVTITGNNVPDAVHYYFFYDWQLAGPPCVSARTPVDVVVPSSGLSVTPDSIQPSCYGATDGSVSVSVTGGTGLTYNWGGGHTGTSLTNLGAGSYTVTITYGSGCSEAETITLPQPAQLTVSPVATAPACAGESNGYVSLNVSGGTAGYTYNWGGGHTNDTLAGLGAGSYTVTVTDAHNCSATASASVTAPTAITSTVTVTSPAPVYGTATISNITGGTGPYSITWPNSQVGGTDTGLLPGTYTVKVTDHNGCTEIDTFVIPKGNGIGNVSDNISFSLYPNPARSEVVISLQGPLADAAISISDLLGQTIISQPVTAATTTLDLSTCAAGVYIVQVTQGGRTGVKKLVINK